MSGLMHRVGHHQRRYPLPGDRFLGHSDHLLGTLGIERGCVFIQQQEPGLQPGGHEQRQSLPLASRQASDDVVQPVLEPHVQCLDSLGQPARDLRDQSPSQAPAQAAPGSQRQVLGDGKIRSRPTKGILEDPANEPGSSVLGPVRHINPGQGDFSRVREESPCYRVEQGRFPRPIGADDDNERTLLHGQTDVLETANLIRRLGVKRLRNVFDLKHRWWLVLSIRGFCREVWAGSKRRIQKQL